MGFRRSWETPSRVRPAPERLRPVLPRDDGWPQYAELRADLIRAGEHPTCASLFALLTQNGRPDLREKVRKILGGDR